MKKLVLVSVFLVSFLAAIPAFAVEGVGVIDMRTAVLATQVSTATFKALEEESEYAGNVEQDQIDKPLLKNFKKMARRFPKMKLLRCKEIFKLKLKI
jgi:Skp family chaperone for outer membrane proteins